MASGGKAHLLGVRQLKFDKPLERHGMLWTEDRVELDDYGIPAASRRLVDAP